MSLCGRWSETNHELIDDQKINFRLNETLVLKILLLCILNYDKMLATSTIVALRFLFTLENFVNINSRKFSLICY